MSEVAQGAGWWIASDGKWYPPDQHPSVRAPAPVAQAPVAHAPVAPAPVAPVQVAVPPVAQAGPDPNRTHNEFVSGAPGVANVVVDPGVAPPPDLPSFWGGPGGAEAAEPEPATPAPPPVVIQPVPSPPRPIPPPSVVLPGALAGGADLANGPALVSSPGQPIAPPAGGYGGQFAPLSPYAESVYRGETVGRGTPRRHFPIWWTMLIVLVVVAAAGGTLYYLRSSNPHRSATAIAESFMVASANGDKQQLQADVMPGQHPVPARLPPAQLSFAVPGAVVAGADRDVNLLICTDLYSGSSCSKLIDGSVQASVPTRQVNGLWYVDMSAVPVCGLVNGQQLCAPT